MCEYENFIWIDCLKTVHTKRKCVLEPKLQNPLFDLVCLSFFFVVVFVLFCFVFVFVFVFSGERHKSEDKIHFYP